MSRSKTQTSLLDTPLLSVAEGWTVFGHPMHVTVETILYLLLAVIAVVAYFYGLGARTQSHDESLHALYSWKLYAGDGYEHTPMMHGPFLFHLNALFYFLFGTSDYVARIAPALFGVILVLLPAFLRKELGKLGALVVSTLTLISPSILYYGRYIRNDIYMLVWAMLMSIALFRYLESRKPGWLYLGVVSVTLAMTTKETAYITGFIGFTFLAILYIRQVFSLQGARRAYILGVALLIVLLLVLLGLNAYRASLGGPQPPSGTVTAEQLTKVIEVSFLFLGILICLLLGSLLIRRDERLKTALALIAAYAVTFLALVLMCAAAGGVVWLLIAQLPAGVLAPLVFTILQIIGVAAAVAGAAYLWWRLLRYARDQGWLPREFQESVLYISVALAVVIFVLLYTTFFTNPKGLATGTFGAISYWLAQQEVKRAGQPWYYYGIVAPLYEFLAIGVSLAAILYYLISGKVDRSQDLEQQAGPGGQAEEGVQPSPPFVAYAVFWTLSAWLIYSWAGEKMPWMMVHVIQPMILLTGRFLDDVLYGVDWRQAWRKGALWLALLVPIILLSVGMVLGLPLFGQAFQGMSLNDLNDTFKWLLALLIGGVALAGAVLMGRRLGAPAAWRVVLVTVLALGGLLTVRYAWMAAYINYDTAKEFLVYAHGTPDVKDTVEELAEISRRLYGDEHSIRFAYSSDATWPFEWYFDHLFPNRVFYGREPTRESTDVPVLVVGRDEIAKTEPFLGNRYYRYDRKLIWWPHQDYYMTLSLAIPSEENRKPGMNYLFLDLLDPEKRRALWDVVFYRKYDQSLADWQPSHPFAFYVRKDTAAQLWDYGVEPTTVDWSEFEDPYGAESKTLQAVQVWGGEGAGEGQFKDPRNLAIGPDGSMYVTEGGNHRVQKLAPDGSFVTTWGHVCRIYEGQAGCQSPDGAGGFYDPWGIAVDQGGFVYVADTWNHRIQKFTSDGEFVTMWGSHGVSEGAVGAESLFWGPRAVAVDPDGLIYVSDTGNKRIQVFTPDGQFVTQWGGYGSLEGQFDEPVGLAIASDGTTYVADAWNQRIQAFDAGHYFQFKWDIDSWYGQSLQNKPYLAVDAAKRVYATDPEGYRILVFDETGEFIASLGQYGNDAESFQLPTGIAVDPQGYIYVADPGTHRVLKFPPLE